MPPEIATAIAQFGVAGLIGYMWLSERRAAADRERQIQEAHARILDDRDRLEVLVTALNNNTRAVAALEAGQRRAMEVVERLGARHPAEPSVPAAVDRTPRADSVH